PTLAYNEVLETCGSVEHQKDFGKYFTLNITPTIQGDAFYEVKVSCNENNKLINQSTVTAKKCTITGCSAIFFFARDLCSANEYNILMWKWKNNLAKESLINQKSVREYSKLFILDGQEQLLHYDLADK
uniref:REJ domain-containing protein n=1 Tax=Globodera pallida TaxID=36090 RepID=A0A183C3R4_GLOPA